MRATLAILGAALLGTSPALAGDAPAPTPTGEEVPGVFLVPDVGIIYVRYGEPGGVRIQPDGRQTGPFAWPADSALISRLVREELERYWLESGVAQETSPSGGTSLLDTPVGRGLGTPPAPVIVPAPGAPAVTVISPGSQPGPETPRSTEPVAPDTLAALPSPATPPDSAAAGPDAGTAPAPDLPKWRASVPGTAVPAPPDVAQIDPEQIRRELLMSGLLRSHLVLFETSEDDVLPYSLPILDAIGQALTEVPAMRLRIEGHTDSRGDAGYNKGLSERRAQSIRRYLIDGFDIAPDRLEATGFGEEHLLVPGTSQTAHALNRRVEFRVLREEAPGDPER